MPQLRCIALYYSSIIVAISDQPTFLQMLIYQLLPSQHGNFWEKHSRIYFQGTNKYSEVQFHAFLLIFCLSQGRVSCVCLIRLLPLQFVATVYPALIARKSNLGAVSIRVPLTGGDRSGLTSYRSNRSGPVPVWAGTKPAQIQNSNLNSKK